MDVAWGGCLVWDVQSGFVDISFLFGSKLLDLPCACSALSSR
jgi:hypothetical protein